eukprot:283032_1
MFNLVTLLCSFASSAFALFTYAITSLGDAISFQVIFNGFQLSGLMPIEDLSEIIAEYSIFGWPCAIIQAIYIRKYIDWKLSIIIGIGGITGVIFGLELLMKYQGLWLKRCLGYLILMTYITSIILPKCKQYYLDHNKSDNININTHICQNTVIEAETMQQKQKDILYKPKTFAQYTGVIIAGLLWGFMHGLFGIGGPPLMIWIIMTDINRNQVRGTISCASGLFVHPVTSYYLVIYKKQLDITNKYLQYSAIFIGGMIGLFVGNIFAKKVNQNKFKLVVQLLLIIGAIMLGLYGFPFAYILIPSIAGIVIILFCCYGYLESKKIKDFNAETPENESFICSHMVIFLRFPKVGYHIPININTFTNIIWHTHVALEFVGKCFGFIK